MLNGVVFDDMLELLSEGFAPYTGKVDHGVYTGFGCEGAGKARWMHREGVFVCLGCPRRCNQAGSGGFALVTTVPARSKRLAFAQLPAVSARDLLEKKLLLSVREVEFILSISSRTVYALLEEGVLERHPAPPTRITSESVRREADRIRVG